MIIPGGGISGGAIDGVVNLYVIDDATRAPIAGATVRVGTLDGTTDATGLFVADGLTGPQSVAVKATGYRSELWIGANGANMTVDLKPATDPAPTMANLSGTITGFDTLTVPANHHKTAIVGYSQDDKLADAENNLQTPANANICDAVGNAGCAFTVTSRTGSVALVAVIYDHDTKGTVSPADDTFALIGWATRTGIAVQDGADQSGLALTMVDVGNENNVTVDFGSPPSGLANVAGLVGIELGTPDGVLQLPSLLAPTVTTLLAPKLAAFAGATYRLTGVANNGSTPSASQSGVIQRNQSTAALAAGTWLAVPTGLSLTRTGGSWTAVAGAIVQSADYDLSTTSHLLTVTVFDGSTSFTIPDLLALPTTGTIDAKASALGGTLDVTNFAIDTDIAKVTAFSAQPMTID